MRNKISILISVKIVFKEIIITAFGTLFQTRKINTIKMNKQNNFKLYTSDSNLFYTTTVNLFLS